MHKKVVLAKKRRARRVARFNAIMKCLSILLDVKLLNFAVFGDSFVRKVSNYFVHKPNAVRNNQVVIDALNRVQELVNKYKEERQALREDASKLEAEDEEIAEFASKSKSVDNQNKRKRDNEEGGVNSEAKDSMGGAEVKVDGDVKGKGKAEAEVEELKAEGPEDKGPEDDDEDEDEYNLRIGIGHLDVVNDTKKLSELIYDKRGYFDKAADTDCSVEKSVDKHMEKAEEDLGLRTDWNEKLTDHQILMVWLASVFPNV